MKNQMNKSAGILALLLSVVFFNSLKSEELVNKNAGVPVPSWIEDTLLTGYIEEALNNNPRIQAAGYHYQISTLEATKARTLPDPVISGIYFPQGMLWPGGEQHATIRLEQMFPWFGSRASREQMALHMSDAEYQRYINEQQQIIYDVRKAYYELYENRQLIRIKEENLLLLESFMSQAKTRFETGQGRSAEVLAVEMEQADLKDAIQQIKDREVPLREKLSSLLNRNSTKTLTLPDTLREPTLLAEPAELKARISAMHPEIKQWEKIEQYYKQKEATAKLDGRPTFGLGVEYMIFSETEMFDFPHNGNNMIAPMASISIPIYRSAYRAEQEQAALQAAQTRAYKRNHLLNLHTEWEEAYNAFIDAERKTALYQSQVSRGKRALELLRSDYRGGRIPLEEILRMQEQVLKYELNLVYTMTKLNTSIARLEYLSMFN